MKFTPQSISDVILIEPNINRDDRGCFLETYRQDLLDEAIGYKVNFVQDNESKSLKGALRGLHYQVPPFSQSKLIRVSYGRIIDIVVDLRKSSPSFGKYIAEELSDSNNRQIFIPHGFAHGFVVLSESATISYKVDAYYSAKHNEGIAYNDSVINIDWGFSENEIILSEADKNYPTLVKSDKLFLM